MAATTPNRDAPLTRGSDSTPKRRRRRRCAICGELAGPGRPLSKRSRHPDCGIAEMVGQAVWSSLWRRRDDPEFWQLVDDTLARYNPGRVAPLPQDVRATA